MRPLSQAQIAKRAIECRKIRLWLATHPDATCREIFEGTGVINTQSRLLKMLGMGIVVFAMKKKEDGRFRQHWTVVPQ